MNIPSLLFSFNGRINRLPYWIVTVILTGAGSVFGKPAAQYGPDNPMTVGPALITLITFAFSLWVGLAVQVKRWHDLDKSGWWALVNLVPVIGWIWALFQCGFMPGTTGENRFGADPLKEK